MSFFEIMIFKIDVSIKTGNTSMLTKNWIPRFILRYKITDKCLDNAIYCIGGIGGKGGTYERRLETVECLELGDDGNELFIFV